jgi:glycosyltransferase involved in cell wall biosynthesis
MRILITTGIYPPAIGGPATHVAQVAHELRRRGHHVTVVTLADGVADAEPGVTRLARGRFVPWRMGRTVAAIVRNGRECDVLYVQGLWIEAAFANVFLRRSTVRKIVGDWAWERAFGRAWSSDSFDDFQKRRHFGRAGLLKLARAAFTRSVDRVIVPSEHLKRCVAGWGVAEDRIEVIPNAIDTLEYLPKDTVRQPRRIVAVGRLTRWKGFEQIIAALAFLPGARLAIVGDGPEQARLESGARTVGARDRVEFLGRLARTQVMVELAASSCFVLNSGYEGFPHVLLEAFMSGTPVVAADIGGIAEIIQNGENGLLVPAGDTQAIACAIQRIFDEAGLADRLREGGIRSLERYSQKRMFDRLEATLVAVQRRAPAMMAAL